MVGRPVADWPRKAERSNSGPIRRDAGEGRRIVLITGASRGLGRACALEFGKAGYEVLAAGRDVEALEQTGEGLQAIGASFCLLPFDVTDEHAALRMLEPIERLDVLVNNAGIARVGSLLESSTQDLRHMFETNVVGAFVMLREGARKMIGSGGGTIVNIASDLALRGTAGMAAYCASKHALLGLSRSARLELREQDIRVICVCPGPINTEILGEMPEGAIDPGTLARLIVDLSASGGDILCSEVLVQPTRLRNPV